MMVINKKPLKHTKIRNTGVLFEILTRQLTVDIMNGNTISKAQELIEKNFGKNTELGKEHRLYQSLSRYRANDQLRAESFINEVIEAHKRINKAELKKSKYNLIKEIKESYDLDSLFKTKIDNYKLYASIYKIFQAKSDFDECLPEDIINSKYTITENIVGKREVIVEDENSEDFKLKKLITEYEKQNADLRILTYKIMVDRFNQKYNGLNEQQKQLLKEFINNIASSNSLNKYMDQEIPSTIKELTGLSNLVNDKVVRIKINEVLNQLDLMKECKNIDDKHVVALLNTYELIKELKFVEKKK